MLWKSTFDKFLFNTLLNLGITNLVRVALYKVLLKFLMMILTVEYLVLIENTAKLMSSFAKVTF